jgi:hypothetical protein
LFGGRDAVTHEEVRQVFLGCGDDPRRALCFAGLGLLVSDVGEIRRAADLGDAFAQAWMAGRSGDEDCFRWAEKSAAQGERDGLCVLAYCWRDGTGCDQDAERAKANFFVAIELGDVYSMICLGELFDEDDPRRCFWFGRAAANGYSVCFLSKMSDQIRKFNSGSGHANVVFAIGRALKGHIDNEKRTVFGEGYIYLIGPANQALHFYEFQLQSYRKAVDSWAIVG